MNILTVQEAQNQLDKLVAAVADQHQPVEISGARNAAILLSKEDWNAIQETLYLVGIPGMAESMHRAAAESLEEATPLEEVEW
ncbi:type II toxin-antitoxin system Phd/YefM family antitoxin [cf. Phormidesmis sp. LEGE 11477]|uniref:type II toxin-antitoxin system Phd/YefM family antitoxin n=1 Tax=cf. Phormidesmis sp. LEGE 11477 TaxID=1828680 RepID=UPI0018806905|nr:type II toxin-antitoxin system Phd/YefM family antitoxin [cf. Phormidesmis sp. LEGE 11477]MBE9064492.1 type II toxin-antitoxin system Phd/YefM family antitoxin [cf. Phormidesmis sp. LEGE 11477]